MDNFFVGKSKEPNREKVHSQRKEIQWVKRLSEQRGHVVEWLRSDCIGIAVKQSITHLSHINNGHIVSTESGSASATKGKTQEPQMANADNQAKYLATFMYIFDCIV